MRMAPTKEEEDKLLDYNGDLDELSSAERFVKELLTVSSAFQRIEAMLYRDTFEDEVIHLQKSFAMLEVHHIIVRFITFKLISDYTYSINYLPHFLLVNPLFDVCIYIIRRHARS